MATADDSPVGSVFVVIDPTRLTQPALGKAEWVAARNGATLHVYCCLWDADVDRNEEAARSAIEETRAWLDRVTAGSQTKGFDVVIDVDWAPDWRERIPAAARDCGADLIVKNVSRHSQVRRRLMQTSDWTLLRNASCPTLLVDPGRRTQPKRVLAAVKLKPGDETHSILNEKVIRMAHRVAGVLDAELHAVTVYKGDDVYFDRQRFADNCGLPRNRVHATDGSAPRGIAEVARSIPADALIIGSAAGKGNTAQRVIDEVDTDIIVIPA